MKLSLRCERGTAVVSDSTILPAPALPPDGPLQVA
jgi:hypothetical protein